METIAKKVVQNWAAKGYISDDEVEMCLYNLIRHTFTVAVLCVLTVVGALLGEWSNTIVLIVSILFLRTYTNGYHCKSCVACIFLSLAVTLLSANRCSERCKPRSPAETVSRLPINASTAVAAITASTPCPHGWSAVTAAALTSG